jgi:hypothetical protein
MPKSSTIKGAKDQMIFIWKASFKLIRHRIDSWKLGSGVFGSASSDLFIESLRN